MNGAEVLLRTLLASGIDVSFMNPGTSEMQFVAALDRVPGMRAVPCLFEGVASGAADAYARMLGKPASTLLHLGPGLANALANFHNARKARVPIVSIVGEHSTQHMECDAPLSAEIDKFASGVSDQIIRPANACELGAATTEAIRAACEPPGQIAHLIIAADFSWSEAGSPGSVPEPQPRRVPDVSNVRDLLRHGREVTLVLSGSALTEAGVEAAGRLAATYGVRVCANRNAARLTSGRARFQPSRIPYFPEPAEKLLAGTRHLVLVESSEPVSFFGYPNRRSCLAPEDAEIHMLASVEEDGMRALQMLADGCGPAALPTHEPTALPNGGSALDPERIGQIVAHLLPEHAIVSDESISSAEPLGRNLLRAAPHDLLTLTGGSIGQGLPAAIGAAIACPDRKVVAMEADGSAMYTLQALWTMARERLDVTIVIYNNRRYRILDVEMKRTGANGFGPLAENLIDIGRPDIDFVRLAESMGVEASRATTAAELADQFSAAMKQHSPRLIEAVL